MLADINRPAGSVFGVLGGWFDICSIAMRSKLLSSQANSQSNWQFKTKITQRPNLHLETGLSYHQKFEAIEVSQQFFNPASLLTQSFNGLPLVNSKGSIATIKLLRTCPLPISGKRDKRTALN